MNSMRIINIFQFIIQQFHFYPILLALYRDFRLYLRSQATTDSKKTCFGILKTMAIQPTRSIGPDWVQFYTFLLDLLI